MSSRNGNVPPILTRIGIKHFKGIRKSGTIRLKPFTVFVGDNGSGKTSVLEALQAYRSIVMDGLDAGFAGLGGFECAWNANVPHYPAKGDGKAAGAGRYLSNPMRFDVTVKADGKSLRTGMSVSTTEDRSRLAIVDEYVDGADSRRSRSPRAARHRSMIAAGAAKTLWDCISAWQFLGLKPGQMRWPIELTGGAGRPALRPDAGNIGEYLTDIMTRAPEAYECIMDTMKLILPYVDGVSGHVTMESDRMTHLVMRETKCEIPSWAMSAGTLRILALLSLLRDPEGPRLIAIDEIENGLDPRSVHLLISDIRSATEARHTQVIATSHSPYLIDQLSLDEVIVTERDGKIRPGAAPPPPVFWCPSTSEDCQIWAESFATGQIYAMDQLHKRKAG